jgi:hypothetical protein
MHAALLALVCATAACSSGTDVQMTIVPANELRPAEITDMASLVIDISGASTAHAVRRLDHPFADGQERIVHHARSGSGKIVIQVNAVDSNGVSVATGSVEAVLNGKTVSASVTLQRAAQPNDSPCDPAQCTTGVCRAGGCGCGAAADADCAAGQYCDQNATCSPWTPKLDPGLVLWLDPDAGLDLVGTAVSSWRDSGGRVSPATGKGKGNSLPIALPGALNGHTVVHFDGNTYLFLGDPALLRLGTGSFVIAIVARYTRSPYSQVGVFYQKANIDQDPYTGVSLVAGDPYFQGHDQDIVGQLDNVRITALPGSPDNRWLRIVLRRYDGGTQMVLRINGQDSAIDVTPPPTPVDVGAYTFDATIGGNKEGTQQLIGDIAEVIITSNDESAQDVQRIEAYLQHKYGF